MTSYLYGRTYTGVLSGSYTFAPYARPLGFFGNALANVGSGSGGGSGLALTGAVFRSYPFGDYRQFPTLDYRQYPKG